MYSWPWSGPTNPIYKCKGRISERLLQELLYETDTFRPKMIYLPNHVIEKGTENLSTFRPVAHLFAFVITTLTEYSRVFIEIINI